MHVRQRLSPAQRRGSKTLAPCTWCAPSERRWPLVAAKSQCCSCTVLVQFQASQLDKRYWKLLLSQCSRLWKELREGSPTGQASVSTLPRDCL